MTGMAVKTDATRTEAIIQARQKATLAPSSPPACRSNPDLTKRVRLRLWRKDQRWRKDKGIAAFRFAQDASQMQVSAAPRNDSWDVIAQ
jgi:hypothetical protein